MTEDICAATTVLVTGFFVNASAAVVWPNQWCRSNMGFRNQVVISVRLLGSCAISSSNQPKGTLCVLFLFIFLFWEATWALPCNIAQTCPFGCYPTSLLISRFLCTPCVCGGRFGPRTAPGQNPQSCTYIGSPQRQDSDTFSYRLRNSFGHARPHARTQSNTPLPSALPVATHYW